MEESGRHLLNCNWNCSLEVSSGKFHSLQECLLHENSLINMIGGQKRQIRFLEMYTESMDIT